MPVSTDGVLLGSWAFQDSNSAKMAPLHILDIGTGTGLLALMCAQRFLNAEIHAIDIDQHAYHAAKSNINHSPWAKRIVVEQADILVVVGTSLNVYPAAGLVHYIREDVPVFVVDPVRPPVYMKGVTFIEEKAGEGVAQLKDKLKQLI